MSPRAGDLIGVASTSGGSRRPAALALLLLLLAGSCGGGSRASSDRPTLRVGLVPNVAPETQRARYQPFAEHLRRTLGVDVELFVATNYAGTVAAIESGNLDLAHLGGLTYVQARQRADIVPLVTEVDDETGSREYLSRIVTTAGSGIESLTDLRGENFAFGDPSSTSGSLYPRAMLVDAGFACSTTTLDSCPPLGRVVFAGGHDAAIQALASDQVAAAGVEGRILARLQREGKAPTDLRVLAERRAMGYPWVAPASLDAVVRARLIDAFTSIRDPALLDLLGAERYEPVTASDYADIEQLARRLGLLAEKR